MHSSKTCDNFELLLPPSTPINPFLHVRFATLTHQSGPGSSAASTTCCSPPVQPWSTKPLALWWPSPVPPQPLRCAAFPGPSGVVQRCLWRFCIAKGSFDSPLLCWTPGRRPMLHWLDHQGERQQRQADRSGSSDRTKRASHSRACAPGILTTDWHVLLKIMSDYIARNTGKLLKLPVDVFYSTLY